MLRGGGIPSAPSLVMQALLRQATAYYYPPSSRAAVSEPVPYSGTVEGWFPEEDCSWTVLDNPDGTSALHIITYSFCYNLLTSDVRFYRDYSFDISYTVPPVAH